MWEIQDFPGKQGTGFSFPFNSLKLMCLKEVNLYLKSSHLMLNKRCMYEEMCFVCPVSVLFWNIWFIFFSTNEMSLVKRGKTQGNRGRSAPIVWETQSFKQSINHQLFSRPLTTDQSDSQWINKIDQQEKWKNGKEKIQLIYIKQNKWFELNTV